MTDEVNHPEHYTSGGIECIDAIEAALTPEEFRGYCKGNAIKYIWRERFKQGNTSLEKSRWYHDRLLKCPVEEAIIPEIRETPTASRATDPDAGWIRRGDGFYYPPTKGHEQ